MTSQKTQTFVRDPAPLSFDSPTSHPIVSTIAPISTIATNRPADIDYETSAAGPMKVMAAIPSKALELVKASDAGEVGQRLNDLVGLARKLDPSNLGKKSLFTKVTELFGAAKHSIMSEYNTVDTQINQVLGMLQSGQAKLSTRMQEMHSMYHDVQTAHNQFEHQATQLEAHRTDLAQYIETLTDPIEIQRESRRLERCEMQIDTLKKVMQLAKLNAQQLSDNINNCNMLVDRIRSIEMMTIPAWRSTLYQYIVQQEMRTGAELSNSIADATEEALKRQSSMHKENAEILGQATRRSIISIETMQTMHTDFVESLTKASEIAATAKARREADSKALQELEAQLLQHVVPLQPK